MRVAGKSTRCYAGVYVFLSTREALYTCFVVDKEKGSQLVPFAKEKCQGFCAILSDIVHTFSGTTRHGGIFCEQIDFSLFSCSCRPGGA